MAEKIIKMRRQKLAAPLLPAVPVAKKQQQLARAFPPLPAVQFVSLWGVTNAGAFGVTLAMALALYIIDPCVPLWMLLALGFDPTAPPEPDAAADAKARALAVVAFLCAVAQAAAATTALLLAPRRRRIRRALANVVLAATVGSHYCVYVSVLDLNHAEYRHVILRIISFAGIFAFVAGDLLCFLALVVGSDE